MRKGHLVHYVRWVEDDGLDFMPSLHTIVVSILVIAVIVIVLNILQYIIQNILAIIIIGLLAIVLGFATYPWKLNGK